MKKTITFLTIFILIFNIIFTLNINSVQAHSVELDTKGYISMPYSIFGDSGKIGVSSSVESSYELYYQQVDISKSLDTQISEKYEEYNNYYNEEKAKLDEEKENLSILKTECENIINDSNATEEEKKEAQDLYKEAVAEFNLHVKTFNAKLEEYEEAIKELKPSYVENNWIKTTDGNFQIDTSKYTGKFSFILWAKLVIGTETYYDETRYTSKGSKEITVSLDKTKVTMNIGDTLKLVATTNSNENITWSSNKDNIATVNSDGTITAKAEGVATITATVEDKTATCTVTVTKKENELSESITINKSTASIKIDETVQLTATSSTNSKIIWTSNDSSIATVTSSGLVKGIKEGTAVITAKGSENIATCTVTVSTKDTTEGNEDNVNWTDFSNAKIELKKDGTSGAIIEISNVVPENESYYYLSINSEDNIPNVTSLTSEGRENLITLSYDKEKKIFYTSDKEVVKSIERNQELYLSIIENKNFKSEKIVVQCKKIERFAEPKYADAFFDTFMSEDTDQIVTTFTHSRENNRKLQIKIGKITDTSILQKIKKQDSTGFSELLNYAKANNGIYDEIVDADKDYYTIAYNAGVGEETGKSVIDLKGLQNEAYYFLYIKTDDENGKYISNEAVTLAQANVFNNSDWSLFFFGESDFKWADFSNNVGTDNTTSTGIIPNAGAVTIIWIILGFVLIGIISYKQYQKNNF